MNKTQYKPQALALRKKGLSYNEIASQVPVSKGTLSVWLRDVSLSDEALDRLEGRRVEGRRVAGQTRKDATPHEVPFTPLQGHPKWKGDIAEAEFVAKCLRHQIRISVPFGDNLPYDAVVETPNGFLKVQVKVMTPEKARGVHTARLTKTFYHEGKYQQARYAHGDFDLFVGYAIDLDRFVMLPWGKIKNHSGVSIRFESENKWSPYIDRWDLLT